MSFRKGLKSVTQSRLERDCRYLRQYDTRCNIGLEKDDPYDRYNLVESSTSVATESSSYTSLCTENNRAVSSSSQSRSAVDRERCNKSRDRGKDHRKPMSVRFEEAYGHRHSPHGYHVFSPDTRHIINGVKHFVSIMARCSRRTMRINKVGNLQV
uniref:Uncharacterized protein n=1 Tax=Octopus bimaculoides TaxID=37653 RepID=A0A0L8FL55_OCTBM